MDGSLVISLSHIDLRQGGSGARFRRMNPYNFGVRQAMDSVGKFVRH
jgi:hypothetical protein